MYNGVEDRMLKEFLTHMKPVIPLRREEVVSTDGTRFDVSTVSVLGVHTSLHMLVSILGSGDGAYDSADQFTDGQDVYATYLDGIEGHMAYVDKLKKEPSSFAEGDVKSIKPRSRELETEHELHVRKDIVISRDRDVYRVSTVKSVHPIYFDETLVTRLEDGEYLFQSGCTGLGLHSRLVGGLRRGDLSVLEAR